MSRCTILPFMELFAYVSLHTRMCRRQEFYLHNNANGKLSACISITRVQSNLLINNKCSKRRCFSCETVLLTSQVLVYVLPGKMSSARVHGNYKYMRDLVTVCYCCCFYFVCLIVKIWMFLQWLGGNVLHLEWKHLPVERSFEFSKWKH